jgi:hypothetical protein
MPLCLSKSGTYCVFQSRTVLFIFGVIRGIPGHQSKPGQLSVRGQNVAIGVRFAAGRGLVYLFIYYEIVLEVHKR